MSESLYTELDDKLRLIEILADAVVDEAATANLRVLAQPSHRDGYDWIDLTDPDSPGYGH